MLDDNVLQLNEGGDFGAIHCQPSTNFDISTKLDLTSEPQFWIGAVMPSPFFLS
jgi:hypothetical protein